MFGFLNSAILLGLAAIAVPILIHLFARRRRKRILFSSVAMLRQLETRRMQRFRLLRNILLLIRILAVLLIVLAFARPVIRSQSVFRVSQTGAAQILIIDRSASMNRSGVFEKARTCGLAWGGALKSEDEASLVWMDHTEPSDVSWRRGIDSFLREITQSPITSERGNLGRLVPRIQELLSRTRELNKEIYLISDFQASGMKISSDSAAQVTEPVSVFAIPVSGASENVGIVSGGVASQILQPGLAFRVFATVQNFGDEAAQDLRIRVSIDGKAVAQQSVRLSAGESRRVEFLIAPESSGSFAGMIAIDDDVLSCDNTYYFAGQIPDRLTVFLIGNSAADLQSIALALSAFRGDEGLFQTRSFTRNQDWAASLPDADAVLFSNYPSFSARETEALRTYFESGGGAAILPGPNMDAPNYQSRILEPFCQIRIGGSASADAQPDGFWSLGGTDFQHPLLEDLFQDATPQIASPRISRRLELSGASGLPVLTFRDGLPLLFEKSALKGRILLFASGVHPTWSDWPYTTLFAPLIYRAGLYLSSREDASSEPVYAGEPLQISFRPVSLDKGYSVLDPEENRIGLAADLRNGQISLTLPDAAIPGVYRFSRGESEIVLRAVNVDRRESDLRTFPPDSLRSLFPNGRIHILRESDDLDVAVRKARWGRELWREALFLGLLLLVAEIILSRLLMRKARQG